MAQSATDASRLRKAISTILAEANKAARKVLEDTHKANPWHTGQAIRSWTWLADRLVGMVFRSVKTCLHPRHTPKTEAECLSVVAVGGYGRAEMAPYSDIDLLFLTPCKPAPRAESMVESMLYILWDIKLKVGHSTRTIDECLRMGRSDLTIRTALLESRYLCGDKALAAELDTRLWNSLFKVTGPEFVARKREERRMKQGRTRFLLEPDVKESKGGLRDLQTLFWITKYLSGAKSASEMIRLGYFTKAEYHRFAEAADFLWTVRCHMHMIAGRASEKLTFDAQVAVAEALGYQDRGGLRGVEAFMQDYFIHATHVGDLTRHFLTALEAQHTRQELNLGKRLLRAFPRIAKDARVPEGYRILHGRLAIKDDKAFLADPLDLLRIFAEGLRTNILIHPNAMRLVVTNLHLIDDKMRQNPKSRNLFMALLLDYGNPERALRRMNELGVLAAFLPEWQRIRALMQFNMYHRYTVDEHTIQCISNLAQIEKGRLKESLPVASRILEDGVDRRVLYVALLLHDIGKGLPEDHSAAGARLAADIAPALGLTEMETETVVWLVQHHLLMSDVAQKRDLSDPKTVREFAGTVRTTARLNLLTVLTVCDIRGVGPGTWNNWKAQLLRTLHKLTRIALQEGLDKLGELQSAREAQATLAARLTRWTRAEIEAEHNRHYPAYWQGLNSSTQAVFAKLMKKASVSDIAVDIKPDPNRDATRACFVMQDHPGIFSRLAGALALAGANVVDARSYTTKDGYATSVFWVQDTDGTAYERSRMTRLRTMINRTLKGEIIARDALQTRDRFKKRERDFIVPTAITIDNNGSDLYTIIEVDTRDRPGLLFDLAKTLTNNNIAIANAVIATYGEQAVDVFYVKDMFGLKLHSGQKQERIIAALKAAVEKGVDHAMDEAPA